MSRLQTVYFASLDVFYLPEMRHLGRFTDATSAVTAADVLFLPGSRSMAVTDYGDGPLRVIDLETLTVSDTIGRPFPSLLFGSLALGPRP